MIGDFWLGVLFEYLSHCVLSVSSLSLSDIVLLKAELLRQLEPKLNCETRHREIASRPNGEAVARALQAQCTAASKEPRITIDGIGYHKCLCQYRHPASTMLTQLWAQYQKGVLPFPGSYVDQPAYLIDAFNVIDHMKSEKDRADHEKAMKASRPTKKAR